MTVSDDAREARLSTGQRIAYSLPQIGINLMGLMTAQWLTFYYLPPSDSARPALVAAGVFAFVMLLGRLVDGVADPLIGYWSDRTRTRLGRRMPFILLGTPGLALTFLALWFPPGDPGSLLNAVYLACTLILYWIFFTVVIGPYSALLPEIAGTSRERVVLSSVMALFVFLGTALGLAVGPLQSAFPDGLEVFGVHFKTGIQAFSVVGTLVLIVSLYLMPLGISERPHTVSKDVPAGLFTGMKSAFKNPAFVAFMGLSVFVQLGAQVFVIGLPYLCTQVLERSEGQAGLVAAGHGETWTGILQAVLFVGALLLIPLVIVLSRRFGKTRLMIGAGWMFAVALLLTPAATLFPDPAIPLLVMVVVLAFPVACALVLINAISADVIDYDEEHITGFRREGIYAGASAFIAKSALGLANGIVVGLLVLGSTRANPDGILLIGPAAGILIAVGTLIYSFTPVRR